VAILFLGLWLAAIVGIFVKMVKNKYASARTVEAVVVDKHIIESFSAYSGNGKREKFEVVFSVDGKKKAFYVSEFSYGGYWIGEKGMLTYKGDRLIGFK
jgi:hypothetical protein